MGLEDRLALVAGATSGIGRATAEALAAAGAHVLVSGRDKRRGAETVAAIEATGGRAEFALADLASPRPDQDAGHSSDGRRVQPHHLNDPTRPTAGPGEIAETIIFLASDRASYLNGAIPVDGGRVAV